MNKWILVWTTLEIYDLYDSIFLYPWKTVLSVLDHEEYYKESRNERYFPRDSLNCKNWSWLVIISCTTKKSIGDIYKYICGLTTYVSNVNIHYLFMFDINNPVDLIVIHLGMMDFISILFASSPPQKENNLVKTRRILGKNHWNSSFKISSDIIMLWLHHLSSSKSQTKNCWRKMNKIYTTFNLNIFTHWLLCLTIGISNHLLYVLFCCQHCFHHVELNIVGTFPLCLHLHIVSILFLMDLLLWQSEHKKNY